MYIDNYLGQIIAQDHNQTLQKEAKIYQWRQQQSRKRPLFLQRLRWQIGRSVFGTEPRLQAQLEA
ncbi:MAG: hypothetical protein AAF614_33015 [Chloroflexota bacterium]